MRILARLLPILLLAPALPAGAGDLYDPQHLPWTRLEFKARKLFLTARSDVRLKSMPAATAAKSWIESPRGAAVQPRGPRVLEVTIETSGVGSDSTNSVWFDPARADAFQRLKTRHGKNGYCKAVRFGAEGTFVRRTAPTDGAEARRPPDEWSRLETFYYPHPSGVDCRGITEPSVLFYVLSADLDLKEGSTKRLCVFSDKQVVPVAIEVEGSEEVDVDYVGTAASAAHSRRRVDAWRVAVRPLSREGEFELMGLDGEIEVLLEKATRLPVEVRGRISGLGRVEVHLTSVERGRL